MAQGYLVACNTVTLFINVSDENLNTHFRDESGEKVADTPVLLYDAHEEHAGPLKSMATETPVFNS